jgi:hypothetical protein
MRQWISLMLGFITKMPGRYFWIISFVIWAYLCATAASMLVQPCFIYCYFIFIFIIIIFTIGKGKTIPLPAWRGPEGSRRLKLPHFKTIGT